MESDLDEENMEDVILDDERECHWRIIFEENNGGVDEEKYIIHEKR